MAKKTRRLRRHEYIKKRSSEGTKPWRNDGKKDTEASEARRQRGTKQWRHAGKRDTEAMGARRQWMHEGNGGTKPRRLEAVETQGYWRHEGNEARRHWRREGTDGCTKAWRHEGSGGMKHLDAAGGMPNGVSKQVNKSGGGHPTSKINVHSKIMEGRRGGVIVKRNVVATCHFTTTTRSPHTKSDSGVIQMMHDQNLIWTMWTPVGRATTS